jgi:hypothetical protein
MEHGLEFFSVNSQEINILVMVVHKVSAQLLNFASICESSHEAYVNKKAWLCIHKTLFISAKIFIFM